MTLARRRAGWFGISGAAAALFVLLALAVLSGALQDFDVSGLQAFRDPANATAYGPAWLEETGRDVTALGSNGVLALLVLAGSALLAGAGQGRQAACLLAAFVGALVLNGAAKYGVARPRPDLVPSLARTFTTSFPSSHATASAAVLLSAAALGGGAGGRTGFRVAAIASAVALAALIGLSRIYLGVHWPTDVLAGWLLGGAWGSLCVGCLLVGR